MTATDPHPRTPDELDEHAAFDPALLLDYIADTAQEAKNTYADRRRTLTSLAVAAGVDIVSLLLERAGLDIFAPLTYGTCPTDPEAGWISSPHGLSFDVLPVGAHRHAMSGRTHDLWVKHPETGRRVCKLDNHTSWADVCLAIMDDHDVSEPFGIPEPIELSPTDLLTDALGAYIRSIITAPLDGGF